MTQALHARIGEAGVRPAVTPLYQTSAFEAGSPYFYTRKNNPNVAEFEGVIQALEGAAHGVAVSTGMAAVRACLDLLRPGDTVVANRLIYGCSFKLLQRTAARYDLKLVTLDLSTAEGIDAIPASAKLVFFETPTNPFLKTVDIRAVAARAHAASARCVVVVDNTWATPLYQRPLELGADVSLHSATKYLGGHSDVMGGILLTAREDLAEAFRETRFYSGAVMDPHSAWLLRRSVQTLGVRVHQQARATAELRRFLAEVPQVSRVYYPAIDGRQLKGYGGILFVQLRADLAGRYADFARRLRWFGTGTGMACVTSMVAQPYSGSHASMTDAEKREIELDPGLVRLCFGVEDPGELRQDLAQAFAGLDEQS